jgi:uncharacterized surface protein with fasciclin (FAS1) repeats
VTRLALLALLIVAAGCGDSTSEAPATPAADTLAAASGEPAGASAADDTDTVLGIAATSADLTTFVELARLAGLDAVLTDTARTLTVFAPSNAAFEALGADALTSLRADPATLRARLSGHVLAYRLFAADADAEQTVESVGGPEITLVPGTPLVVRGGGRSAQVATADLDAGNGVVHVIDSVLGS